MTTDFGCKRWCSILCKMVMRKQKKLTFQLKRSLIKKNYHTRQTGLLQSRNTMITLRTNISTRLCCKVTYRLFLPRDMSKIKTQAHRDILATRHAVIDELFSTVQSRITQLTLEENLCLYKKVLFQLIIQGLFKIMEPNVVVEVRQHDVVVSKKVIKQAQDYFQEKTGMTANVFLSENHFLPEKGSGGVVLYTKSKTISLDNTLDTRLSLVRNIVLPSVRKALFGENPNRRHAD
uniref:Uncharacterized protein n=1 Tax=Graphocephala atropunctata TaxID=36148 RepID=A0A1B6MVD1_9HEMI